MQLQLHPLAYAREAERLAAIAKRHANMGELAMAKRTQALAADMRRRAN